MNKNRIYLLLIIQAILTLLLFFSQGFARYVTIILFCIIDIALVISLIGRKWTAAEVFMLVSFFYSMIFLVLYIAGVSDITVIMGILFVFLLLVTAFLVHAHHEHATRKAKRALSHDNMNSNTMNSNTVNSIKSHSDHHSYHAKLMPPREPSQISERYQKSEVYDLDEFEQQLDEIEREGIITNNVPVRRPLHHLTPHESTHSINDESVHPPTHTSIHKPMHVSHPIHSAHMPSTVAQTVQEILKETKDIREAEEYVTHHELQRQVQSQVDIIQKQAEELRRAEKYLELKDLQRELAKSKKEEKIQKNAIAYELEREAFELRKADNYLRRKTTQTTESQKPSYKKISQESQLVKEALALEKAGKYIKKKSRDAKKKELQNEVKQLRNAQEQIKRVQEENKRKAIEREARQLKKAQKQIEKIVKSAPRNSSKSMYVSKEKSKTFHRPTCTLMDKVPKNKLILFISKQEAQKKGYNACRECKP